MDHHLVVLDLVQELELEDREDRSFRKIVATAGEKLSEKKKLGGKGTSRWLHRFAPGPPPGPAPPQPAWPSLLSTL
jgi:hypothetical protein